MLRNTDLGYGTVAKGLHWLTVLALVCQFTVVYLLDDQAWLQPLQFDDLRVQLSAARILVTGMGVPAVETSELHPRSSRHRPRDTFT